MVSIEIHRKNQTIDALELISLVQQELWSCNEVVCNQNYPLNEILESKIHSIFLESNLLVCCPKEHKLEYFVFDLHDEMQEAIKLPSVHLHDLWSSLFFDVEIKQELIKYVETIFLFQKQKINKHLIQCNQIVALYGPPGTGKTSLCRALAQKMSIRLQQECYLVNLNPETLLSKYFSESGKNINELFEWIFKQPKSHLFFIHIDEVESLCCSRESLTMDPSDAMRVVNSVLTCLDRLTSNVFVLATSNLIQSVDSAFLDRIDLKILVQVPNLPTIYKILQKGLQELMRVEILIFEQIDDYEYLMAFGETKNLLLQVSKKFVGSSARTIKKLLFLAFCKTKTKKVEVLLEKLME